MDGRISLADAAKLGIERVRLDKWVNSFDHIKIDIIDGQVGPWLKLFAPFNKECNGHDPVVFPWMMGPMKTDIHSPEFTVYTGPLPDSDEYRAAQAACEGCLTKKD